MIHTELNRESTDKLQALAKACAKMFNAIFEWVNQFIKRVQENWKWLKTKWIEFYQLNEKKEKVCKRQYLLNFSRKKIMHQVIDRRPKQMIRKIIY